MQFHLLIYQSRLLEYLFLISYFFIYTYLGCMMVPLTIYIHLAQIYILVLILLLDLGEDSTCFFFT